jgi:dienelactone hydrolase
MALGAAVVVALLVVSGVASTYRALEVVPPSGEHAVGRWQGSFAAPDGHGVGVVAWYPALPGTGVSADYFADLDEWSEELVASGEVSSIEARGLQWVRARAREGAEAATIPGGWPVLLLSPGNATNVEFYASIAEDLASRGYLVVGLNHPGQVPLTLLPGGPVLYQEAPLARTIDEYQAITGERVAVRVQELEATLDWLSAEPPAVLAGAFDLESVGALGHSLGGIAAAELCARDTRVDACVNMDGLQGGGPYGVSPEAVALAKPFMFITKEEVLQERIELLLESGAAGTYRVVVPGAAHSEFGDGPALQPKLFPWQTGARDTLIVTRGFAAAFFDRYLRGAPEAVLGEVDTPRDVILYGYPLRGAAAR